MSPLLIEWFASYLVRFARHPHAQVTATRRVDPRVWERFRAHLASLAEALPARWGVTRVAPVVHHYFDAHRRLLVHARTRIVLGAVVERPLHPDLPWGPFTLRASLSQECVSLPTGTQTHPSEERSGWRFTYGLLELGLFRSQGTWEVRLALRHTHLLVRERSFAVFQRVARVFLETLASIQQHTSPSDHGAYASSSTESTPARRDRTQTLLHAVAARTKTG